MALLGMLLALNIIALYGGSIIESNTLLFNFIAALILGVAVVESGKKGGLIFYISSVILAFVVVPNKVDLATYAILLGPYGLLKEVIEGYFFKKPNRVLEVVIKLFILNVLGVIAYTIMIQFLMIPMNIWLILGAQVLFFIYDYAFGYFIHIYIRQIKPRLR